MASNEGILYSSVLAKYAAAFFVSVRLVANSLVGWHHMRCRYYRQLEGDCLIGLIMVYRKFAATHQDRDQRRYQHKTFRLGWRPTLRSKKQAGAVAAQYFSRGETPSESFSF
jgi:hypothetical protein